MMYDAMMMMILLLLGRLSPNYKSWKFSVPLSSWFLDARQLQVGSAGVEHQLTDGLICGCHSEYSCTPAAASLFLDPRLMYVWGLVLLVVCTSQVHQGMWLQPVAVDSH